VLASRAERREVLFLFSAEGHVTVARVIVVRRQLAQQATDAVPVSGAADQRHGARRQRAHVLMYLSASSASS